MHTRVLVRNIESTPDKVAQIVQITGQGDQVPGTSAVNLREGQSTEIDLEPNASIVITEVTVPLFDS